MCLSSFAIILSGKRELVAPRCVIVVFPDHRYLFFDAKKKCPLTRPKLFFDRKKLVKISFGGYIFKSTFL